ncbi:hypothetical protein EV702DRAFT_265642 [Suillus placidus]|uniref:Uncharacterized protein n=1 Tax=Suillus placidus TaxID=48579 RepID=A0A9P6ZWJ9_9AGAM|nr:hypothetical protein EV702DRAFT_265642 [Suillus placidus]
MSLSLPALAFFLALQSIDVAASVVYLPEPANNGNGNGSSSTTASASTSTTSSSVKHQSSTTYTSNTHTSSSSTSITQSSSTSSSSTSTTATTGTLTSSSSSYTSTSSTSSSSSAPNNVYGSTSTTSQGLSAAARTGLAFGIMIFLILSAMLVWYLRRRCRIAREKTSDGPALLSSEISQYHPPAPGVSPERELLGPPPPRLNPAYPNMPDISRSSCHSAISSIAPLLSDISSRSPRPVSAWNRYSTSSSATNTQPITTEDVPTLPNPHDPSIAPTHSASHVCSTPHTDPFNISVLAPSAATMSTFTVPAGGSSNSQEPPLSSLYTDLVQHQKQLELEHDKRLEAQEGLQDPPPEYFS